MCKISSMTFPEFLEQKYLQWQADLKKRKTIEEFAAYVGVSRPLINMWMNGDRNPGAESLKLLSAVFGMEVYDAAGVPRPNAYLQKINQIFERLSPEHQRSLAEDAEKYFTTNHEQNTKAASKRRKTQPD